MTTDEMNALLDRLLAGWENEVVEFKEAGDGDSTDKIGEYFKYLPDVLDVTQQRSKVTNLLSKMRRDGRIHNVGTQQKPRWELV